MDKLAGVRTDVTFWNMPTLVSGVAENVPAPMNTAFPIPPLPAMLYVREEVEVDAAEA